MPYKTCSSSGIIHNVTFSLLANLSQVAGPIPQKPLGQYVNFLNSPMGQMGIISERGKSHDKLGHVDLLKLTWT